MVIQFSEKQLALIRRPFIDGSLEVNEGTPRSGKTTAGAFRAARYYIETQDRDHLVLGYNHEQAFKLFIDCDGMGLLHIFAGNCRIRHDPDYGDFLGVTTPDGRGGSTEKRIFYKGGGKADSYKSFQGLSFGSVVFLEIDLLHSNTWQEAFRRTMAARKRWHLADLNPPSPQHPVIKDVFEAQRTIWQHWTMDDNPILTLERKQALYEQLKKSPYLYERDWLGHRCIPQGVIYSMFSQRENVKAKLEGDIVEMYFSGDGGLSDATSVCCNIVTRDSKGGKPIYRLYRAANYYYSGSDTGTVKAMSVQAREIALTFVPWCRNKFGRRETCLLIDPACKALREELKLYGLDARNADNNGHEIAGNSKGIKVGIERVQSSIEERRLLWLDTEEYGHYDCFRELGLYVRDQHGNPVDAYNHAMDDMRYGHNYFYKHYIK